MVNNTADICKRIDYLAIKINPATRKKHDSYIRLDFKNSPGNLKINEYRGKPFPSMQDVYRELGKENSILFVTKTGLPKDDLVFLIKKSGLQRSFDRFCETLAFCTAISAFDKFDNADMLDGLSIFSKDPRFSGYIPGVSITPQTIFINSIYNGQHISTYRTIINLAHELCHHEIWEVLGTKLNYDRKLPPSLSHFLCTLMEKQAAEQVLGLADNGKIFGMNKPRENIIKNIKELSDDIQGQYKELGMTGDLNLINDILGKLQMNMSFFARNIFPKK